MITTIVWILIGVTLVSLAVLSVFDAGAAPELRMLVQRRRGPDGLALLSLSTGAGSGVTV